VMVFRDQEVEIIWTCEGYAHVPASSPDNLTRP
jgi:hypothetical protein